MIIMGRGTRNLDTWEWKDVQEGEKPRMQGYGKSRVWFLLGAETLLAPCS